MASCGASLYTNSKGLTKRCRWRGCSLHKRLSIFLSVQLKRSTNPLQIGWYGVVVSCFMDSNLDSSSMHFDTNCVPRSLKTSFGIPRRLYISSNASATVPVLIFLNGTVSGYLVALSIKVRIYQCPFSLGGEIGPTKSTATLLNGISIKGISPSGTGGTDPLSVVF